MNVVTTGPLPAHVKYRWDFGDAKPKVTVDDNPNVQYAWDLVGTYQVTAEIIDVRNDQVIARAQAPVVITGERSILSFRARGTPPRHRRMFGS